MRPPLPQYICMYLHTFLYPNGPLIQQSSTPLTFYTNSDP